MYKSSNQRKKFIRIIKNNSIEYTLFAKIIENCLKKSFFDTKALSPFEYKKEPGNHVEEQFIALISNILKQFDLNFILNQPPFKNETDQIAEPTKKMSSKTNNGFFGMKMLIKRKKSAPEQEVRKAIIENAEIRPPNSLPKMSLQSNSIGALYTYQIHLNESCCIEVNASQRDSYVSNILIQTLNKLKSAEDPKDYCLIEYSEYENWSKKKESKSKDDKRSVKTRILAQNENLFLLQHVWNQMKNDNKDGFKFAKLILTRSSLLPQVKSSPLKSTNREICVQEKTKCSKLVRQKSFDESSDEIVKNNEPKEVFKLKNLVFNNLNNSVQFEKRKNSVCLNEILNAEVKNEANVQKKCSEKQNRRQSTSTLKRLFKF
ncbi:hypothetical protein BpHYR1_031820 [Brachionus plicatilis]|uniref:Uncharacterized protein n=1 Tax=Brachionus plicatilis TaxID=10195 RepID=A0A3M7SY62_BRAPC|nr:hypothetical protein BpHYR1_031820 [Brachionus plicatilis]